MNVMSNCCRIDGKGSGVYATALHGAARRFCAMHPEENWQISGVAAANGFSLKVANENKSEVRLLSPVLDMEQVILETLERLRSGS